MNSEIIIYQNSEGNIKIDIRLKENVVCRNSRHTTQHNAIEDIIRGIKLMQL